MNLVFLAWKGHDKPRQKLALAKHCIKAFNGIWRFHGFIFANIVKDTIIAREVDLNTKILCLQKVSLLFYYLLNEILEALLSSIVFFFFFIDSCPAPFFFTLKCDNMLHVLLQLFFISYFTFGRGFRCDQLFVRYPIYWRMLDGAKTVVLEHFFKVFSSVSENNSNTGDETGFLRREVMMRLKPMFSIVTFVSFNLRRKPW